MLYKENMSSESLINFMKRLVKDAGRKIYLILDSLKVHHNYLVSGWLEKHKDRIEVFYLPSFSPELNPDEYLNNSLKGRVSAGLPGKDFNRAKQPDARKISWETMMTVNVSCKTEFIFR